MQPSIAALLFTIGIGGLFYLERDKKSRTSWELWIPTLWLFFCFSRSASQWLGMTPPSNLANSYIEGNPLDRTVFIVLELAALAVTLSRWARVRQILLRNLPFALFFSFAAASILWSDYPFVTLKHWIKGIGDLMMVMIVLTDDDVDGAIKRVFTRLAFVLVPLSVLFIKYYPQLGRVLNLSWTMEPVGVSTQKNGLGEICDYLGLLILWRFRNTYNDRDDPNRKQRLLAFGVILAMIGWLLYTCNSLTSICALSMASLVMLLSKTRTFSRKPALVHVLTWGLLLGTVYALFLQSSGGLIEDLGRNPTLTGRTAIWQAALSVPNSKLVGAGYESFWLGHRLSEMWNAIPGLRVNEAHNGYIEIFLTLGWVGIGLLALLIVTGYKNAIASYRRNPEFGSLRIAIFLAVVINAMTEAAFRMMGPPWIAFLIATAAVPTLFASQQGSRKTKATRRSQPASSSVADARERMLTRS